MSLPAFIRSQMFENEVKDLYGKWHGVVNCPKSPVPIHYLTFATTNWPKAIERAKVQTRCIQESCKYFKTVGIKTEHDLPQQWFEATDGFAKAPGYRWYSWKPQLIEQALEEIPDGEVLMYLDAGCTFPMDTPLPVFFRELNMLVKEMCDRHVFIGMCKNRDHKRCRVAVPLDILRFFKLEKDHRFTDEFPHWEAGTLLIRNTPEARKLIHTWKDLYIDNLDKLFAHPDEGLPGFIHNSSDQSTLQCILYRTRTRILDTSALLYGHGVYARIRG